MDKCDRLRELALFSRLTDDQFLTVCKHTRVIELQEAQTLFTQGEQAEHFYMVINGRIKLSRLAPDGNEKVIELVGPGGLFAEALMFREVPVFPVTAMSLENSALFCINSREFRHMLKSSLETCFQLLGEMSHRLHSLVAEIDELSLQSSTCRVANYILQLAPADTSEFKLEIPKGVMASRLSIKPETFSRILRHLQDDQVIVLKGAEIKLIDRQALQTLATGLTKSHKKTRHLGASTS